MEHTTSIHDLSDEPLLQIFSCYRLEDEDNWNPRLRWRKLAHICRRWRYLIFDSSSYLDVRLLLTDGSPSMGTLSHLPPIPLIIDYSGRTGTVAWEDENNIHLGLQQHGRVRRVSLGAPSSSLRMWLEPMNKPFPRLEDLSLSSTTTEEESLVLPAALQAPFLRCLALHGIGLPKGLSILSSMISLSTLSLTHIRDSCYFSPGDLVTQLQGLYNLEELSIGFAIPIPLPSSEGELLPAPIPPVTLPALRRVTFRGLGVYLDNLVAQISTPLLERLSLTLFFDLDLTLVNLTEFIHRAEGFGCLVAQVNFNKDGASIYAGYCEQRGDAKLGIVKLSLHVNCEPLDWQIDSATQVCSALGEFLSAAEELTVNLHVRGMLSDWENTLDGMMWHELLLPFIGVKKLYIGSLVTHWLSKTLESDAGGLLLPELQVLEVPLETDLATNAFSVFMKARESVGRPVVLLPLLQSSVSGVPESFPGMINHIPPSPGPPLPDASMLPIGRTPSADQQRPVGLYPPTIPTTIRDRLRRALAPAAVSALPQHPFFSGARTSGPGADLISTFPSAFSSNWDSTHGGSNSRVIGDESNANIPAEKYLAAGSSIRCTLLHVKYGRYKGDPAGLIVFEADFDFPAEDSKTTCATIEVGFSLGGPKRPAPQLEVLYHASLLVRSSMTVVSEVVSLYRPSDIWLGLVGSEDNYTTMSWTLSKSGTQQSGVHPIFRGAIIVQLPDNFDGLFYAQFELRSTQICDVRRLWQPFIQEFGRYEDGPIRLDSRVNLQADGLSDHLEDIDLKKLLKSQKVTRWIL